MTRASFDKAAIGYDLEFSETHLGRIIRERSQKTLERSQKFFRGKKILELNGGTGEDARWFINKGATVFFTDASPEMVRVANAKIRPHENFFSRALPFDQISNVPSEEFDLVFSNFGGLNCICENDLNKLSEDLFAKCGNNSRLFFVVMPPFCLMEVIYFLLRFRFRQAFRRGHKIREVNVNGTSVKVWYHSPAKLKRAFGKHFMLVRKGPMGFAIPPSCLFQPLNSRPGWIKILAGLENIFGRFPFLASFSDHYFMEFKIRK